MFAVSEPIMQHDRAVPTQAGIAGRVPGESCPPCDWWKAWAKARMEVSVSGSLMSGGQLKAGLAPSPSLGWVTCQLFLSGSQTSEDHEHSHRVLKSTDPSLLGAHSTKSSQPPITGTSCAQCQEISVKWGQGRHGYHPGHHSTGSAAEDGFWEMSPNGCSKGAAGIRVYWSTMGLEGTDVLLLNWEREPRRRQQGPSRCQQETFWRTFLSLFSEAISGGLGGWVGITDRNSV